jgi:hypothetical protein
MRSMLRMLSLITVVAALLAQPGLSFARSKGCSNVKFEGVATLGLVEVVPGVFVLGGLPAPATIGGFLDCLAQLSQA